MKAKISLVIAVLCSLVIAGCGGIKAYVPGSGGCSEIYAFLDTTTLSGEDIDTVNFGFSLSQFEAMQTRSVMAAETITVTVGGLPAGVTIDLNGDGNSTTIQVDDEGVTIVEVTLNSDGSLADGEYPVTVLLEREGCDDVLLNYTLFVEEILD